MRKDLSKISKRDGSVTSKRIDPAGCMVVMPSSEGLLVMQEPVFIASLTGCRGRMNGTIRLLPAAVAHLADAQSAVSFEQAPNLVNNSSSVD